MKKIECPICHKTKWLRKDGDCLPCRGGNPKHAPRPKRIKKKRTRSLPKVEEPESYE